MTEKTDSGPRKISLAEWDDRYRALVDAGMKEPAYGGPLRRHLEDGDLHLKRLMFDNSEASLRLWNFLLTEEDRLRDAQNTGKKLIGTMKDLGTVPVMAYSLPDMTAFYPDGAWWIPCVMELSEGLFGIADSLGIDESFCPVRAMLGAFLTEAHFPVPDHLICSVGAVCDDFSAIAQRLNGLGFPIFWWEIPVRRTPDRIEDGVCLPGGSFAPRSQVDFVISELERVRGFLSSASSLELDDETLARGISAANGVRRVLNELRESVFSADIPVLPSLEMLIAEMLAIHFCSDREEALCVLQALVREVRKRISAGESIGSEEDCRIFWVNPAADLRAMNILEECGGRICGTEYLFSHALDEIPEHVPPMEALARTALADPMAGPSRDRADRICKEVERFGSEALIVSRIPGASHCATEGAIIAEMVRDRTGIPSVEIEVPPISDAMEAAVKTRIEALIETVRNTRE